MTDDTKHSILIVDDEPDVLFSLKGLLRHDFQLHTAESGEEALQILREHDIHVIMTDQRMPGMTGVELMNEAKSRYPGAVRIVFTGFADIKAVVEAINSGGLYRYITKPWDPDELIETLHLAAKRYEQDKARLQFANKIQTFVTSLTNAVESIESQTDRDRLTALIDDGKTIVAQASSLVS